MKIRRILLLVLLLALAAGTAGAETRVYFSPPAPDEAPVAAYIVTALNSAASQILVQQYQLTEPAIIAALVAAQKRGVQVIALCDKTVGAAAGTLKAAGVPVIFDPVHIAHNKVLILDYKLVIGGSFNLTSNANRHNIENCTFIDDPAVVQRFVENFKRRMDAAHSGWH